MVKFTPLIAPLFVPANRPERFIKAASSGADAIIVDLEDSVPVEDKQTARESLRNTLKDIPIPVFLRINARCTEWFEKDLNVACDMAISGIMLPKTENLGDLKLVAKRVGDKVPIIALIETASGLVGLERICNASNLAQIAFGSVDYSLDLNCEECREALLYARSEIVLHSRISRLPAPLDGVTVDIFDNSELQSDCNYAKKLGFGGKLTIHPQQVQSTRAAFRPSSDEIEWATRVKAAEEKANGAVVQLDGRMVDKPISEKARRILQVNKG